MWPAQGGEVAIKVGLQKHLMLEENSVCFYADDHTLVKN